MAKSIRCVTYEQKHRDIVESGIDAISFALYNGTTHEKASILLCLDRYLDPYYGYQLKYKSEIIILLQNILLENNDIEIKEDILDLLQYYGDQPLYILEANIDKLPTALAKQARYILYDEDYDD
ncbi:MAG: hypothetical protein J6L81_06820 [Clostridia bacterium]|nr:hypothetical protein [Clostridia bacterium]